MVRHATIRVNTFPSGHVAVSLAVALGVGGAMPVAGTLILALAASIAAACVVGRFHYAMDVAAGVLLAGAVWTVTALVGI
jgi:undecaprenyl-diphosphatase